MIGEDISIDEATRQIVERAEQLYDCNSQDTQTLIHTLQHKLKSLKERLDSKVDCSYFKLLFKAFLFKWMALETWQLNTQYNFTYYLLTYFHHCGILLLMKGGVVVLR